MLYGAEMNGGFIEIISNYLCLNMVFTFFFVPVEKLLILLCYFLHTLLRPKSFN